MDDDSVNRHMFIVFDWAIDMGRYDRWLVARRQASPLRSTLLR
jgi:hypothetical protein